MAADWRPDGWLADFDHLTPQIAEERVTNARDALNALHRVQAISESEQEAAESAAADLPDTGIGIDEFERSSDAGASRPRQNTCYDGGGSAYAFANGD